MTVPCTDTAGITGNNIPSGIEAGRWDGQRPLPDAFVTLPGEIYAADPHWIPESASQLRHQFSHHNPWLQQHQAWLGVAPRAARLAGFFRDDVRIDGEPVAFFGFMESIEDGTALAQLFRQLEHWAAGLGARRLYGPINFSTFGMNRLRLDQFDARPFPGEPYNPPWYPALLESCGFTIRHRYATRIARSLAAVQQDVEQQYAPLRAKLADKLHFSSLTAAHWMESLPQLYQLVDQIFADNFAYTPLDYAAFAASCGAPFAERFCPHASVIAHSTDGDIAGFFLAFPDYGPLLIQGNGSRINADDIDYRQHQPLLPTPRLLLAKTGGVHPQWRSHGLFTALSCELTLRAGQHYQQIAGALVRDDNRSMQFAARHGSDARHYGLFCRALPAHRDGVMR